MRRFLFFCVFSLFTLSLFSKEKAFMFVNSDFHFVYDDYKQNYLVLKKYINRSFFALSESKVPDAANLKLELDRIIVKNNGGLIILDDFLSPLLLKDDSIIGNKSFKLLTYNVPHDYKFNVYLPVFNIIVNEELLAEEIVKLLKRHSQSKDLSDCGLIINPDYVLCVDVARKIENDKYKTVVYNSTSDKNATYNFINYNTKLKVIILFAYNNNDFILDIVNSDNKIFAEVLTDYGTIKKDIKYKMGIRWNYVIEEGVHSKEFKKFMKNSNSDKKITYYAVKNRNIIFTKTYFNNLIVKSDQTGDDIFKKIFKKR